ncbi:MAG: permease prefix domain 1-containing protein [Planctomycetota bacterium]
MPSFPLPYWLRPGDDRPGEEIEDEVRAELAFHLDALADEQTRRGIAADEAERQAAARFGDFNKYVRQCRQVKQGDAPMLKRFQTVAMVVLTVFVGLMGWQQWKLANYYQGTQLQLIGVQNRLSNISDTLVQLKPVQAAVALEAPIQGGGPDSNQLTPPLFTGHLERSSDAYSNSFAQAKRQAPKADLTGVVTSDNGEPIADADVLLIIKTWPNNRFRQGDKAVNTNADGRFTLKRTVPLDGQYGVNAAVVAPGHAIASSYVLVEDPAGEEPESIDFELTASTAVTLRLTNRGGEPLPRTFVTPSARNDSENEDHLVYFQGSKPAWRRTDETGTVEIDWFAAGDFGKVSVKPRGGDWQEHEFETPAQPGEVITIVCDTKGR